VHNRPAEGAAIRKPQDLAQADVVEPCPKRVLNRVDQATELLPSSIRLQKPNLGK